MENSLFLNLVLIAYPYYKKAIKLSPLSHVDWVTQFAVELTEGENLNPIDSKILITAAMFHDIGLSGVKFRKKIVESEIAKAKNRETLIKKACKQRREHAIVGSKLTRVILSSYFDMDYFEDDINEICRLIEHHDDVKIAKMTKDKKWLNDKDDYLLQLLNEADALWMLTPKGIETDIKRGSGFNYKEQMEWNIEQHKKVYNIYKELLGSKVREYKFKNKTLYRSKTGYKIFRRLTRDYI